MQLDVQPTNADKMQSETADFVSVPPHVVFDSGLFAALYTKYNSTEQATSKGGAQE